MQFSYNKKINSGFKNADRPKISISSEKIKLDDDVYLEPKYFVVINITYLHIGDAVFHKLFMTIVLSIDVVGEVTTG